MNLQFPDQVIYSDKTASPKVYSDLKHFFFFFS